MENLSIDVHLLRKYDCETFAHFNMINKTNFKTDISINFKMLINHVKNISR